MVHRSNLFVLSAVAIAAFALLAAGCGGGGNAGVANVRSTTAGTAQSGLVAYARCMRSHGVHGFPDPDSSGGMPKPQVVAARKSDPSAFDSAGNACAPLLPSGGLGPPSPQVTAADRVDYLKAAACMRSHGFANFPDPTFPNAGVRVDIPSSIDRNSSRFTSAAKICTKLIPAGLPYGRPSGP
jgi:hypothetical protein